MDAIQGSMLFPDNRYFWFGTVAFIAYLAMLYGLPLLLADEKDEKKVAKDRKGSDITP